MNINLKEEQLALGFPNPNIQGTQTIYIGKIEFTQRDLVKLGLLTNRVLYIFGALVGTGKIHLQFGELKRSEYVVIEQNLETGIIKEYHLAQFDSVFYRQIEETNGGVDVDMIKKKDILFLNTLPHWKASEASIPQINEELYYFAKQLYISSNKTSRQYIASGFTIYVFVHCIDNDGLSIQFFEQDMSEQTAADHYKLELLMGDFEIHYKDLNKVEELVKQGDKYFYEYVLEHKQTNQSILQLLLKYAKTKKMKIEVEKKMLSLK